MTTTQPKNRQAAGKWPPYPELPPEPKDMQQAPANNQLREILQNVLTPGWQYPYHPTILIGNEIPIYYGTASPSTGGQQPHVVPDCLVAFDVDTAAIWERVGYDLTQNGKPPEFVMEVASRTTRHNDARRKRDVYQKIGVSEYWRFDATGGRFFGQPIIGERLVNQRYERFPLIRYDDGAEGSTSLALNLNFRWRNRAFSVHDPTTGGEYENPRAENARLREELRRMRYGGT